MKKKISIPIYNATLKLILVDTMDCDLIPEQYRKGYGAITTWGLDKNDLFEVVIYFTKSDLHFGLVTHELLHCVNAILLHVGVKPCFENDEAQAYLLGFISNKTFKYLIDKKLL
jgi:hypothetical protein